MNKQRRSAMPSMTEKNDRIAFRTNKALKEKATAILAKNQLDLSTALNMFLGKIVAEETLPLDFRTDQMKAAELNYIEKHLDAAIARRKKGIRGYSLESFEKLFDDHDLIVAEAPADYTLND
ncbi:type II toxin-antitoxin system RelB/DinJ family antitoxin [Lactococcus raffinolactis]|nr:hypothetical protein CMV25_09860 [Lactococcus raffinolactis]MBW9297258.1 type II toxin-antitoxin system RelB/DinJ family antitoxin [Lactococcus raffinolactis]MBW9329927.1 type II toxin-antitoxin system RelB/DinJ family antitoxin [Lactococcus raffinolactis]TLQ15635.1 type II toxin-antitoxin system RelB/DinJ family antitoxin [Lactococcus raffinolactis]